MLMPENEIVLLLKIGIFQRYFSKQGREIKKAD